MIATNVPLFLTRRASHATGYPECFVCDEEEQKSDLRQVMPMNLDKRLNDCVQTLNDEKKIGQTEWRRRNCTGTQVPSTCLVGLYNRERAHRHVDKQFQEGLQQDVYPLAFSELITYIVESKSSKEGPSLLRLADMVQLYTQRLEQLGIEGKAAVGRDI